ncbi:MAG: AAA family ATPase, partial [Planctomycetes bacterium]|nr:AAA family ATPase [Planctomycetota bacterium]
LKKLTAVGFKSFADKMELEFGPGTTCIVGPNGCGKSNVVDAIKWVLGDLSAKSIRGDDMLDCIFNGSGNRPASGFADVSLTFENADGKLPTEFSEVTVTRRLFRSGESEYLINRQPSRRKDILDLFMDTGVGTDAYSIIEQGKINQVLEASPRDRRALIDEAAGISRYRARKKESLARLERVGLDLVRLADTLREMETQIRSLKIQAGKAERYVRLKDEWKEKRTLLALLSFDSLRAQADAIAARLADAETERARVSEAIVAVNGDAQAARAAEEEATAAFHAAGRRREAAAKEVEGCESAITDAENLAAHMEEQAQREEEALAGLRAEAEDLARRESAARAEFEAAEAELAGVARQIEARREACASADEAAREAERAREDKKRESLEAMEKRARYSNEGTSIEAHRQNLAAQRARAAERTAARRTESEVLAGKIAGILDEKASIDAEVDRLKAEHATADARQSAAKTAAIEAGKALAERRESLAKSQSKLDTLRDIERQMEGVGAGAKRLVEASRKGGGVAGFRGLVADLVEFDPAIALAAEAILGDRAQAVVFDDAESMRAGLGIANGRVAVLSLDRYRGGRIVTSADALGLVGAEFEPAAAENREAELVDARLADLLDADFYGETFGFTGPAEPAADDEFFAAFAAPTGPDLVEQLFPEKSPCGLLASFVKCAPELMPLARALCGRARIVGTRDEALRLLADGELDAPAATLDGDVVHPDGLVVAGGARAGLIRRRAEARALAAQVEKLVTEVEELSKARAARAVEEAEAVKRCQALRNEIYDRSHDAIERKAAAEGIEKQLHVLRSELELLEREEADARAEEARLAARAERIAQLLAELEALEARLHGEVEDLARAAVAAGGARDEARRLLGELQVAQAQAAGRRDKAAMAAADLGRQIGANRTAAAQVGVRIAECGERHRNALAAVEERRARLADLERTLEAAAADAAAAEGAREGALAAAREAAQRKSAAEADLRAAEQVLQKLTIEQNTIQVNEENLVANFRSEQGIDLREAEKALPRDPAASAETLGQEVEELRRRIDNMGGVNPEAIHELKEKEEKFTWLKNQEQDLIATKGQLEELIRKINRESRELLVATLEQVKVNFNEMFRRLFGGGKAELVTEEGVDILDCGIDLMAKPPGKEPATIAQLSGGEKTLTVLAFIMALFQLKPSPFCMLDEVDAPLDEANVDRFNGLIRSFSSGTQFIVITHNKKTMAATDVMYGVTMQERGVSKKVSVRMGDKAA